MASYAPTYGMSNHTRVVRNIAAVLHKKHAACTASWARHRYEKACLGVLRRAGVPPFIAHSIWTSLYQRGWTPDTEAYACLHSIHPDTEPRKYAAIASALATTLSLLSRDATLAECCRTYHESCNAHHEAVTQCALEAARLDALRREELETARFDALRREELEAARLDALHRAAADAANTKGASLLNG